MPSLRFSLREHKLAAVFNPVVSFSKPTGTKVRVHSTEVSIGRGYCFIVCPREWLHGKSIRWNWNGYWTNDGRFYVKIYDGEYDRSSDTDFPSGSDIPIKGNGLLQTLDSHEPSEAGTFGPETMDVLVDVSGGTQDKCTLFFYLDDKWIGSILYFDVDWVEINTGAGGSGTLYDEQFTDAVHMEVTGTYGDYGYISTGTMEDIVGIVDRNCSLIMSTLTISDVIRDADANSVGNCTVQLYRTESKEFVAETTTNWKGEYSFTVSGPAPHFLIAFKSDGAPVFGASDRDVVGS